MQQPLRLRPSSNHVCVYYRTRVTCNHIYEPQLNYKITKQRSISTHTHKTDRQWEPDITFWTCPFWLVLSLLIRQSRQKIYPPTRKEKEKSLRGIICVAEHNKFTSWSQCELYDQLFIQPCYVVWWQRGIKRGQKLTSNYNCYIKMIFCFAYFVMLINLKPLQCCANYTIIVCHDSWWVLNNYSCLHILLVITVGKVWHLKMLIWKQKRSWK